VSHNNFKASSSLFNYHPHFHVRLLVSPTEKTTSSSTMWKKLPLKVQQVKRKIFDFFPAPQKPFSLSKICLLEVNRTEKIKKFRVMRLKCYVNDN
jgi:hypothetical protein